MNLPPLTREWVLILVIWSLLWKGPALWKAARRGDKGWYIAMLLISTLGILEYIYIFMICKDSSKKSSKK